ncbi:MAG: DUF2083 domain-containing protein [Rhodobacteraceae bacterium]|nr:DUF2083 domain-containing protein [Paracoccaceae bacterium]
MVKSVRTGTRIRERREALGLRQGELAALVEISPSYLNLIEHNRRRIGGRLLLRLAEALEVEASQLSEGIGASLLTALVDAASSMPAAGAEIDRVEEFASRHPGWAALAEAQHRRILTLERTVEALTDRLAHDPHLATSLHEVLSTVTAIRSTAGILADGGDLDPRWQERFHRNLYEDSRRLAEGAQALVSYLDVDAEAEGGIGAPQEEVEAWLARRGYHFPELEGGDPEPIDAVISGAEEIRSAPAEALAAVMLDRYRRDAERIPLDPFHAAAREVGFDPSILAGRFGCDLPTAMRRLASLPMEPGDRPIGLIICDGSGSLTFRKPIEGFPVPRFGAGCPLWPLYRALAQPALPIRALVEPAGQAPGRFVTYAMSQPHYPDGIDAPPVFEVTMMIMPDVGARAEEKPLPVGGSCRVCPRRACMARREPSILADGL